VLDLNFCRIVRRAQDLKLRPKGQIDVQPFRMGARSTFALAILVVIALLSTSMPSVAATKITIRYDEVDTEVGKNIPDRQGRLRQYILTGKNNLRLITDDMGSPRDLKLGSMDATARNSNGSDYKNAIKIMDGAIFIITDFASFTTVRKIYTDKKESCRSTFEFVKKKGHPYFESAHGSTRYFSDMRAENMTCSIETIAD